jgi:acyl-coenzyme A thioesterase 13
MGVMHGGAVFSVMDIVTTMATIAAHPNTQITVSTEINMSYYGTAAANSEILMIGEATKIGKRLAFSEFWAYDDKDNLLYRGH